MSRATRSGARFSPYDLDRLRLPLHTRPFEVIQTKISLDTLLQKNLAAADVHAADLDAQAALRDAQGWEVVDPSGLDSDVAGEWDDVVQVYSRTPSPLSSTPSSQLSSCSFSPSPSPSQSPPPTPGPSSPHPSPGDTRQQRNQKAGQARRKKKRKLNTASPYTRRINIRHSQDHRELPSHAVDLDSVDLPAAGGGSWVGRRGNGASRRLLTVPELVEEGCEIIHWNGRDPKLILDDKGRIIAILLGMPEDPEWPNVVKEALKDLICARRTARRYGAWCPGSTFHRRGDYLPLTSGVSFGGGQKRPGNLVNSRILRRIIRRLLRSKSLRRIAGFQSSGLAFYAPKLYRFLCNALQGLFDHQPELVHNFTNSVFPAATFNCGPDAVTVEHLDHLNLSHGLCGNTCGGNFDSTRSGLIHMRQLRLMIEFPSAASILIPSGCIDHGNTPIQPGESRHSMTQYAAGGLFRWAAYGYRSAKSLLAMDGGKAVRDAFDGVPGSRWQEGINMFSKYDELASDRASVFGLQ
ncbi:hypothetical protein C8R44DRAFT_683670 [Mycena epipterygia]|nr:hypothetical protein C8R44DRAFT_683670 [Mycena epipterygia]